MIQAFRKHYGFLGASLLLLIFLCELTLSIRQQSLSWDEGDHIFAGYQSWKAADFGINPEHPPLVKALATIPLLFMSLKTPAPKGLADFKAEAYFDGRDLIFHNGGLEVADRIIFRARMTAAILSLLLGFLVYVAARELFGTNAALFALALLVVEPNMIAHGAYVTTDMGVACLLFASVYALYRYVCRPNWTRLIICGVVAGLALSAKHSAVLFLPISLALVMTEIFWPPTESGSPGSLKQRAARLAGSFVLATFLAVVVLWAFYHFRYAARPDGLALNPSLVDYAGGLKGFEPKIYLALARWHILPESYVYGLVDVRLVSNWFPTYIFGQVHAHGVWYYFPAAFVIKSTIGFMVLLLLALGATTLGKVGGRRKIIFLTVPPTIYFLIALGTGLNIGARHILPMYPFFCVWIGGAVAVLAKERRAWAYVAGALLGWHIVSSSLSYPTYLAYSNEFWGGANHTYKYLTDSNTDWGQQLHAVKQYLDQRHTKECWFAYFVMPAIDYRDYGIPCKPLPTADSGWFHFQVDTPEAIQGTVLISAGDLTDFEFGSNFMGPYRQFQSLAPTAVIQHGVFVFDGTFDMRFASALGHVTRAQDLVTANQLEPALKEAREAVNIDPQELQAQLILGDTLAALGRPLEAKPAFESALSIAERFEPSAAANWVPQIEKKLAAASATP